MTITDIAKLAGVGVSTVSRVINKHPDVKKETREKVLRVIKENNYVPNNSARILKQNTTNSIGILVRGIFNSFFSALLKKMSAQIEQRGYSVIVHYYNDDNDINALVSFIKEKRLQGVIGLGGNFSGVSEESFSDVEAAIVLVCVDFRIYRAWNNFSTVSIRNEAAGYLGAHYLIENGHKNIAIMLGSETDLSVGQLRFEGYKRALLESGIPFTKENVMYGKYDINIAYKATKSYLRTHPEITAIFAISDMMALGAAKAISDLKMRVGEDISVLGFDGTDVAKYYQPTIATIKQPQDKLAKESVELLFNLLEKKGDNKQILLETELIKGDSVKKVNKI